MKDPLTIILENFQDVDGKYDIRFHNQSVVWAGTEYQYHSSGLCRHVYIDPDHRFVLKIPHKEFACDEDSYVYDESVHRSWKRLPWSVRHNILEAAIYNQCPDHLKHWFAKTELIDFGWVKQEFVEVKRAGLGMPDLREVGIRLGTDQIVLFDFDPFFGTYFDDMPDDVWPEQSFERVIKILQQIK